MDDVRFATFTGKASLVLNRNGIPATTIHKLIYVPVEEVITDPITKKVTRKTKFVKKDELPYGIKLIVLDECSMIDEVMLSDLISFDIPIIVLGDEMQLPPINGKSILLENPDVRLTQIMRQAEGNPIIHLCMLAREGKEIQEGKYGNKTYVITRSNPLDIKESILTKSDIILTATNKTRNLINDFMREVVFERKNELPEIGDKMICRRNNWTLSLDDTPLINGLIGFCHNPLPKAMIKRDEGTFNMDFRPEFMEDNYFDQLICNMHHLLGDKETRVYDANLFEYAYAITYWLAQGSQWNKVLMYEEIFGNDRSLFDKTRYVGITRAVDMLIYVKNPKIRFWGGYRGNGR